MEAAAAPAAPAEAEVPGLPEGFGPLPAPAVTMEQLVSLEAMAADALRRMVLAVFEENHQLRSRLQRANAAIRHQLDALRTARGRYVQARAQDTGVYHLREREEQLERDVQELFVAVNSEEPVKSRRTIEQQLNDAERKLKEELMLNSERSERLHLSQRTIDMLREMLRNDPSAAPAKAPDARPVTAPAPSPRSRGPKTAHIVLDCTGGEPRAMDTGLTGARPVTAPVLAPVSSRGPKEHSLIKSSEVYPVVPSVMRKEPPLNLIVKIMPGALVTSAGKVDKVHLTVRGAAFVADIKDCLEREGVAWGHLGPATGGPHDEPENQGVQEARLLLQGAPLRLDLPVAAQGVRDGSELRLLRSRVHHHKVRARCGHEPGAARGLLMNPGTPAWRAALVRTGPNAFFDGMQPEYGRHLAHMTTLALAKVDKTDPLYHTI